MERGSARERPGAVRAAFGAEWSAALRRGADAELRGWVEAALGWCDETDAIALEQFRRDLGVRRKPDRTFVTLADTAIERRLRERIADAYPDHGVVGEEYGVEAGEAETRWYVDPIDGTHNYMRGVRIFGTLLAVERAGELQAAVLSAPALNERWYGWRGGGAWAIAGGETPPRRLAVSSIDALGDAHVVTTSTSDVEASGRAPGMRQVLGEAWRERGFGDFWSYTLVAEGAAEAMFEVGLSPWDAAAPWLLVEEAGGRVTDLDGRRRWDDGSIIATNGLLHDVIRTMLVAREETPR